MRNSVLDLAPQIRSRRMMLLDGWTDRGLAEAVRAGALHQVRRGWYIGGEEWRSMWPEDRHRVHVIAVSRDATGGAVAAGPSAAVLWRIPLYRLRLPQVHLITDAPRRISSGGDVVRHVAPLSELDTDVVDGIRCTSLSRTVFDLIRTTPLEAAVSAADAAERMMAQRGREWDLDAVESWRMAIAQRIADASGARGIRQARWVADFADGRAQLPGESVSRLHLHRLGFARPRLQVRIPGPNGAPFFVDFGLDDVDSFGEFDGETKYSDEAMRRGKSVEDVLLEEKQREDWIRGRTGRRFARWGSPHIETVRVLAARLRAFGITPP
ncbi:MULTISPECIES: hypothetical protein [unclassified Microbacterium]|uniref:hypothetical protein n=1 Tax=unclassified Microbacterium TaxID=2609290 RepID=UPI0012F969BF|nr:hypothetical protein [Microbacterium sp. MAH-37]MVQ40868.1 hypothetical protein [Microbacterium sp. MAH-37]